MWLDYKCKDKNAMYIRNVLELSLIHIWPYDHIISVLDAAFRAVFFDKLQPLPIQSSKVLDLQVLCLVEQVTVNISAAFVGAQIKTFGPFLRLAFQDGTVKSPALSLIHICGKSVLLLLIFLFVNSMILSTNMILHATESTEAAMQEKAGAKVVCEISDTANPITEDVYKRQGLCTRCRFG